MAAAGSALALPKAKPDHEGYLTKRSAWLKEWRKRYFRLIGNKLYFSKDMGDQPHGFVDLKDCLTVKSAEEKTGKAHSFEVATPEETFYMYAETDGEKDEWIGAIGKAIVRYSSSYTKPADEGDSDDDDDDDDE